MLILCRGGSVGVDSWKKEENILAHEAANAKRNLAIGDLWNPLSCRNHKSAMHREESVYKSKNKWCTKKCIYIFAYQFFFINFWPSLAPLQIHAVHQHSLFLSKNKFTHDLLQVHTVRQQCRLWLFVTLCIHFRFVGLHAEIETVTQVQSACCSENQALVQRYYI